MRVTATRAPPVDLHVAGIDSKLFADDPTDQDNSRCPQSTIGGADQLCDPRVLLFAEQFLVVRPDVARSHPTNGAGLSQDHAASLPMPVGRGWTPPVGTQQPSSESTLLRRTGSHQEQDLHHDCRDIDA